MNFDPSPPNDSRRNFVKKSLAASIIAAQPTILAGLIRAQGGGGGTGTTDPWGTVDDYGTTGFETTSVGSTEIETTPIGDPYKALRVTAGFLAAVTKFEFQGKHYSLQLNFEVTPVFQGNPWDHKSFRTHFEAKVMLKLDSMDNGPNQEGKPYSGDQTSTNANGEARSLSRRINVTCDARNGALSENSTLLKLIPDNNFQPPQGYVPPHFVTYNLGGVPCKLDIDGITPGVTTGKGGRVLITRDTAVATLKATATLNNVIAGEVICSVTAEKVYVSNSQPDFGEDDPETPDFNEENAPENNVHGLPEEGCHLIFVSKRNSEYNNPPEAE